MDQESTLQIFESGILEGNIKCGQIRWCSLKGGNGNLHKTRPCIIMQNDEYNKDSSSRVFVVPLSSKKDNLNSLSEKFALMMNYENKDKQISFVCIDRSVFIDRQDIGAYIGEAPRELLIGVCDVLLLRCIVEGGAN